MADTERAKYHEYDFLTLSSSQHSATPSQPSRLRDLKDLDSGKVTSLVSQGLVLWHVPGADDQTKQPSRTSPSHSEEEARNLSGSAIAVVGQDGAISRIKDELVETQAVAGPRSHQGGSDDEDVVEIMLTQL